MTDETASIAFLHTTPLHIETFNALRDTYAPGLALRHVVHEEFLAAAEKAGRVTPAVAMRATEALTALADEGARAVACTCSTLGPVAEAADSEAGVPIMRIDRPMADRAVRAGDRVGVCACLEATLGPTEALVRDSAERARRDVAVRSFLFDDIWPLFRQGRMADYYAGIAERLARAAADADVLLLAQASMAPAADLADMPVPVLSSPRSGFAAVLAVAGLGSDRPDSAEH